MKNNRLSIPNIEGVFKQWKIDSLKISIDSNLLNVNIPTDLVIYDMDSSEILQNFKSKSLELTFNNEIFYISNITKVLPNGMKIKKFYLLISSKLAGKDYFKGITKALVIDILKFLRKLDYIKFIDTQMNFILSEMYIQDTDFCIDYEHDRNQIEPIKNVFKNLINAFKPSEKINVGYKYFVNKNNLGLQVNHRNTQTNKRPFFKIYNKSNELKLEKHRYLFNLLPISEQIKLNEKLILRYELTIRNKAHFTHYDQPNTLLYWLTLSQESFNISCEKFKREFFHQNFYDVLNEWKIETKNEKLKPRDILVLKLIYHIKTNLKDKNQTNINFVLEKYFLSDYTGTKKSREKKYMNQILSIVDYHLFRYNLLKSGKKENFYQAQKLKNEFINLGLDFDKLSSDENEIQTFIKLLL